ncbi:phosphotransferase family protein [Amycolatopsis acidiphila]|uniref:Phosphotransferase family protein n=1 Tax=Amycolatopsis acidiphila TaxID=715473 RepID=A0A557ZZK3_9PSEU|nr:phosphotransferase family protein [Amycolatopsis acidiphila]TVT17421.1 phosphotransferase family protein [Amycolatopsis acidiphila]UIJ57265.1 phosphotransferase family protein [Amycolatopsis acidiphila]GHG52357.1 aminoglycoside phosphotransferase [Amycolatopsis acidiphila]
MAGLTESLRERATAAAQDWAPGSTVTSVSPLTGGTSSLTFVAEFAGAPAERVVLKVAPPGLAPVRNRDVLRQGRLMAALHGRPGVRVPPVLFSDHGEPPEVPPFAAMGLVLGECVEPALSEERDPARFPQVRSRGLDAAGVLAAIHALDPAAVGLGDEPVMTLGAEIDRWTRAFSTVPADLQHDYERYGRLLHETMPEPLPPVVNHGDYRLGNTLCTNGRVEAVIDWEIWSVGDPRIDLTWFTFFTDEAHHPGAPSAEPSGMPTAAELLASYGRELPDMRWFDALTRYKEAGATALLVKRGRKNGDLTGSMARMVPALPVLLEEAASLVS